MTARTYISGSSLPLVQRCGPAGVLPRVQRIGDRDRIGSAMHEHMADRAGLGLAGALERLGQVAEAWHLEEREASIFQARCMAFGWSPPRGAIPELALCLTASGRVDIVEGGRGTYTSLPPDAILPSQLDIFWAEPEPLYKDAEGRVRCPPGSVLVVADYKSGLETYVDPVERNAQALAAMVLAARWTGARYAQPAIIFLRKGGGLWDVAPAVYDEPAIATAEALVRAIVGRVADERRRYAAGEPLTYVTGRHCTWCDAEIYCPAKIASLKRYLGSPAPLDPAALTADEAEQLAALEAQAKRFADGLRSALVTYTAAHGAIRLDSGKAWGPYAKPKNELDPAKAITALAEEIGQEAAVGAVATKVSKQAMEDAIGEQHRLRGIKKQKGAAMRRVLGRLRAAGGITDTVSIAYGLHAADDMADATAITVAGYEVGAEGEIDGDDA